MAVQVGMIRDESCDHCNKLTAEPLVRFKFRQPGLGNLQLWLHVSCLEKLLKKFHKTYDEVHK